MSKPGAATSVEGDEVEKEVTASFSSVAATVKTCGHEAGKVGGLPTSALLPAAATTRQPLCTAVRIASWICGSGDVLPKLRLMTPGQCCAAARMPVTTVRSLMPRTSGLASKSCSAALG